MIVVTRWHAGAARALRLALRMTCEEFAAYLGISTRGVAKWEATPDAELSLRSQQVLDVALKRADEDAQVRFSEMLSEELGHRPWDHESHSRHGPGQSRSRHGPGQAGLPGPRRVTQELLLSLRGGLRYHYAADNLLGPRSLIPAINAYADTLECLAGTASGSILEELLRVGAGYAEFAGWLYDDSGDRAAAKAWYRRALEWAEAGQDQRMVAFVFVRRAVQAANAGHGAQAARLAAAANRDSEATTARVRAIALQVEALGHAVHGQSDETDRALDVAEDLLSRCADSDPDGDPSIGRYCDLSLYLQIMRARCHLELGRAELAIASFMAALDELPPEYHRDRGHYLAQIARASLLSGDLDQACATASQAAGIALTTGSSRTLADLKDLLHRLRPQADRSTVAELADLLART